MERKRRLRDRIMTLVTVDETVHSIDQTVVHIDELARELGVQLERFSEALDGFTVALDRFSGAAERIEHVAERLDPVLATAGVLTSPVTMARDAARRRTRRPAVDAAKAPEAPVPDPAEGPVVAD